MADSKPFLSRLWEKISELLEVLGYSRFSLFVVAVGAALIFTGQGREIGQYGFDEFLEVKSLVMRIGRTRQPWVRED